MKCLPKHRLQGALVLFTISLAISGCSSGNSPPAGVLHSSAAQADGARLFAAHCAICHGAQGDGQGERREFMNPPPANLTLPPWSDAAYAAKTFAVIRTGVRGTAMPAWSSLSDRQTWQLVAYLISLRGH
jgi:mono/diheme cytochrome c family protein